MKKAVEQRAERIIQLFPKIISSLVKLHQDRLIRGMIDDSDDIGFSKMKFDKRYNFSMTFNQYLTLIMIQELEKCSVKELSQEMKIAQSTGSQLIDRLVKAGFVKRETSSGDRRRMVVSLSKAGIEMMNKRTHLLKQSYRKMLSILDEKEQNLLEEGFSKVYEVALKVNQKLKDMYKRPGFSG